MKHLPTIGLVALAVAAASTAGLPKGAGAVPAPSRPVLVELFTSQGCSSCPPADRVLDRLDREGAIVAISRPVTYWDRLGWKDTLARPANDQLQQRYAARALPGGGVYTPEAVVQGQTAAVGSDERRLRQLIAAASRDAQPVELAQNGQRVTASSPRAGVEMRFLAVARRADVAIGGGENSSRRVTYSNVVLGEAVAACAPGKACSATIPASIAGQRGADRWAAVLQDRGNGTVRAVRWISPTAK